MAVGPVHAGVIEPGHFRFQCHGEEVFHLEISLGYQHRGVERALRGRAGQARGPLRGDARRRHHRRPRHRLLPAGRGAGGHAGRRRGPRRCAGSRSSWSAWPTTPAISARWRATSASCRPRRSAAGCAATSSTSPPSCAATASAAGWCGPAASASTSTPARIARMRQRLDAALADVKAAVELLWDTASVQARFEDTGRVTTEVAQGARAGRAGRARLGPARATCASDHPAGIYRFAQMPVSTLTSGDVFARALRARAGDRALGRSSCASSSSSLPAGAVRAKVGARRRRAALRSRWSRAGAARSATWR